MSYAFRFTAAALMAVTLAACGDGPTPPRSGPGPTAADADALLQSITDAGVRTVYSAYAPSVPAALTSTPCTYADGRYTCPTVTHAGGFEFTRTFAFYDGAGAPQRQYDPLTTASVRNSMAINGTTTHGNSTVEVERAFSQTVSGLLGQETTRVIDGTGTGKTRATTTPSGGTYTTATVTHDTTRALVLPAVQRPAGSRTPPEPVYPLSGSVISVTSFSVAGTGAPPLSISPLPTTSRMVTTFNGTSVARIEISIGGITRSCTLDMAARPSVLSCPGGAPLFP